MIILSLVHIKDGSGKENKCYLFTKMGCEFIANKFTSEKGIIFTAKYVKKFNQMENEIPRFASELELQKVEAQRERSKAMLLNAQNRTYKTIMTSIHNKNLSAIAVQVFGLKGLDDVANLLPQTQKTYTTTQIGDSLGVSANKIGTIANKFNLKTDKYGIYVLDKSRYSNKEVTNFQYFDTVIDKIKELLVHELKNKNCS